MRATSSVSSVAVAAVLLFTGLIHAAQPYYFIHTISEYRLLPPVMSGALGLWLPYLQITLAVCIGFGVAQRVALYAAAAVFSIFAIAQTTVLLRGNQIDCGCFGFVAHPISWTTVMLPVLLVGVCLLAAIGRSSISSQDQTGKTSSQGLA